MVNWRSHGICGGKINILQFWLLLSTRNIFTYPIHDFYEVSVSKNAITSELEAIDKKNELQRLANYLIIISPIDLSFGMKGCFRRLIEPPKFQKS